MGVSVVIVKERCRRSGRNPWGQESFGRGGASIKVDGKRGSALRMLSSGGCTAMVEVFVIVGFCYHGTAERVLGMNKAAVHGKVRVGRNVR